LVMIKSWQSASDFKKHDIYGIILLSVVPPYLILVADIKE